MFVLLIILQIVAVCSVLFLEHKRPGEALLWVLILLLLPGLGLLLYLALGSTIGIKLAYWSKTRRIAEPYREMLHAHVREDVLALPAEAFQDEEGLLDVIHYHLRQHEAFLALQNEVTLITDGAEKYRLLFADLRHAKESIHIAYYAIHNDSVGKALAEILHEKAAQGVTVRVMYDRIGSLATPKRLFRAAIRAGARVHTVKPTVTHFRNHRKIVVIDGRIGYTGGMNIGEKYLGMRPKKRPWRDTQLRMQGDAVRALQYYFLYDWLYVNRTGRSGLSSENVRALFPPTATRSMLPCQVVASGVEMLHGGMKLSVLRLISAARSSIWMQTPYFVPSESILEALTIALASGVEVCLMLPARRSSFFLEPTTHYYLGRLLPSGLRVYLYDGYLHAKTIAIDRKITAIGSVNMDIRSLEIDDEVEVVFYGEAFADRHQAILNEDLLHCRELDYEAFARRGTWTRIKERVFQLFSPFM